MESCKPWNKFEFKVIKIISHYKLKHEFSSEAIDIMNKVSAIENKCYDLSAVVICTFTSQNITVRYKISLTYSQKTTACNVYVTKMNIKHYHYIPLSSFLKPSKGSKHKKYITSRKF